MLTGVLVQDGLEHMIIGHETNGPELYSQTKCHFGRRTPLVPIEGNMTTAMYVNNILQAIVSTFSETVEEGFTLQDDEE